MRLIDSSGSRVTITVVTQTHEVTLVRFSEAFTCET